MCVSEIFFKDLAAVKLIRKDCNVVFLCEAGNLRNFFFGEDCASRVVLV